LAVDILIGRFRGIEIGAFSVSAFAKWLPMGLSLVLNLLCPTKRPKV
jgi:hypothetical protein